MNLRRVTGSFDPDKAMEASSPFSIWLAVSIQAGLALAVGHVPPLSTESTFRAPWLSVLLSVCGGLATYVAWRERCRGPIGSAASILDCGLYSASFVWAACNTTFAYGLVFAVCLATMLIVIHGALLGLTLPAALVVIVPTGVIIALTRPPPLIALVLAVAVLSFVMRMEYTWQALVGKRTREVVQGLALVARSGARYRLLSELGSGGMGVVFRAEADDGRSVALKILHPMGGIAQARALAREARAVGKLAHAGIVPILDDGLAHDGRPFLVMELLEGNTLRELVANGGGRMGWTEVARIARSLLDILGSVHDSGIVHRDVKPSNVFVDEAGRVRLLDFGIARLDGQLWDTTVATHGAAGTPAFVAPEQVLTPAAVDGRSDLWSVGALMFWATSGALPRRLPEPCTSLASAVSLPPERLEPGALELPPAFTDVVNRALSLDPARRFASAREMDAALARHSSANP